MNSVTSSVELEAGFVIYDEESGLITVQTEDESLVDQSFTFKIRLWLKDHPNITSTLQIFKVNFMYPEEEEEVVEYIVIQIKEQD